MNLQLYFENAKEVSLFKDEDTLMVELWGPFLSEDELAPISERVEKKYVPP